ncbi:MAG TPA: Lrp/AsnC ligand binding domain-containing protein [Thermoplasmata archaeon]|nr:Lrp/AsnC ligand binding domain-containing protein [Thermoplasmata archaeon]
MPDPKPPLTLYVESRKAITSFYRHGRPSAEGGSVPVGDISPTDDSAEVGATQFFLSDDQARAVALVEELAGARGYAIDVKDIAKAGRLERIVTEHLRNVTTFPVLIAPDGRRLEGSTNFTEERICEMMPTELPHQRAFSYLKVRGGDFETVRKGLLNFNEVREIHFLTGDWDVFVVLEFMAGATSKRQVLEFVTQQIRAMPEVVDTSTLVPEVTVTKFPI